MKLCKTCKDKAICKEPCGNVEKTLKKEETYKNHLTFSELGIQEGNVKDSFIDIKGRICLTPEEYTEEKSGKEWSANDYETDDWHLGRGEFRLRKVEPLSPEEKKKFDEYTSGRR